MIALGPVLECANLHPGEAIHPRFWNKAVIDMERFGLFLIVELTRRLGMCGALPDRAKN